MLKCNAITYQSPNDFWSTYVWRLREYVIKFSCFQVFQLGMTFMDSKCLWNVISKWFLICVRRLRKYVIKFSCFQVFRLGMTFMDCCLQCLWTVVSKCLWNGVSKCSLIRVRRQGKDVIKFSCSLASKRLFRMGTTFMSKLYPHNFSNVRRKINQGKIYFGRWK